MTVAQPAGLVGIGPSGLHAMRAALEASMGEQAARLLQEAGYASGTDMYQAFAVWLLERANVSDPAELDASFLGQMASEFFQASGWGSVTLEQLGDAALALDSAEWAEAGTDRGEGYPSCHFTTGMLSAFMTQLAGQAIAVMQVECLSCGHTRCRFLVGSSETLQNVFDAMVRGENYGDVLVGASPER